MDTNAISVKDTRRALADALVRLSPSDLSVKVNKGYIALTVESGPNSVAIVVSNSDRVGFIIRSTALLETARKKGFTLLGARRTAPMHEHKYYFRGLKVSDIEAHDLLFREIVRESVTTIRDRRPKKDYDNHG